LNDFKLFALGGQDEKGKNLYVIEIEDSLFVFDFGIKHPEKGILGIDAVIPSIDYLIENEKRVKGVFISSPSSINVGAISQVFKVLKNVNIYCNDLVAVVIKANLTKMRVRLNDSRIKLIKAHDTLNFGNVTVEPFQTTASYPETFGYALHTPIGTIVYMGDYVIDGSEQSYFSTDMKHINAIANKNILAFISDSENASRLDYTVPHHRIEKFISAPMKDLKKRLIIGIFEEDIFKLFEVVNQAREAGRKVAIYGRTLQKVIESTNILKSLGIDKKEIISVDEFVKTENNVLLIAGTVEGLYSQLARIANGNDDLIEFTENDTLIIATPPAAGVEKKHAEILDELARTNARLIALSDKNIWSMKASFEDIKFMTRIFKPKAFVPIKGLYKDLLKAEQAAKESGVLDGHTALIDNGQILKINKDGECVISRDEIKTADAYIDGIGVGDIGSVVLNERRQLATDGVVIIGANIDNKTKELVSLVDMQMRGVIFIQDENPIFKALHVQIQNIFENGVKTFKTDPRKFDINEIRKEIISKVRTMIKKDAGKQPIVLAVINEIDGNFKPRPSRNN
jgi:ribonuclease J